MKNGNIESIIIKCFIYPNLVNSEVLSGHLIRWQVVRLRFKAQKKHLQRLQGLEELKLILIKQFTDLINEF